MALETNKLPTRLIDYKNQAGMESQIVKSNFDLFQKMKMERMRFFA